MYVTYAVMAGLVSAIHVFEFDPALRRGCPHKAGHDEAASDIHGSPGLNGASFPGGTPCSLIARIMAIET